MYRPAHFEENRSEVLHAMMQAHPLAQLVTHGADGLDANPLPFELDTAAGPHGTLRAHVARANPVWQQADGTEVLVIFQAAQGYISPNWYPSKPEHHRHVPTWNYAVVHAHGRLHVMDDERFVRGLVARLTREHEQRSQQPRPWRMGDSAPDFIDGMLQAIVGVEVEITRLVGKFKLGQNREARDREGAAAGLDGLGQHDLAEAMRSAAVPKQGN
ncbi:MAG: FMN-binding negative transcriptional regulator [Hydrogenophaga sp.]|uniref:FMN-binding negative transcriptional regulator n=1 Tax=Hydrogenophaga sp. TaxID=1904254 RepID=UPI003D9BC8A4